MLALSAQITKAEVDQFKPKLDIPCCSLELQWTGGDEVKPCYRKVTLEGAQPRKDYFYISYYPQAAGKGKVFSRIKLKAITLDLPDSKVHLHLP